MASRKEARETIAGFDPFSRLAGLTAYENLVRGVEKRVRILIDHNFCR